MNEDLGIVPVENAIISVYYKDGIVDMAKILTDAGVTIYSSGGTAREIREAGMEAIDIADATGFPPMFDHRVATLHPFVHGGILYRRNVPEDVEEAANYEIPAFNLVVANLYPVEEAIATGSIDAVVQKTDIGGPTLLRGAAKNHEHVAAVCVPEDYIRVAEEIAENGGTLRTTRQNLAFKVFDLMAGYDGAIRDFYAEQGFGGVE